MSEEDFTIINPAIAVICAVSGNVGLHALNKFLRLSRGFAAIQWKVDECRKICKKWSPQIEKALDLKKIGHPFRYTGKTVKNTPLGEFSYNHTRGIILFDAAGLRFPAEQFAALTDIYILTTEKVEFYYSIAVHNDVILFDKMTAENYINLGMFSEATPSTGPKYMVCLRLPLRNNPIPFDDMFACENDVALCIGSDIENIAWQQEGEQTGMIRPQVVANINYLRYFTHIMMSFVTSPRVGKIADCGSYALMYDGTINTQAMTTSFVRSMADIANEINPDDTIAFDN